MVLPGILILVPGVAAYASLRALDSGPTTGVTGSVEGVVFQIFAILAGLYVAGSVMALPGIKLEPAVPAANECFVIAPGPSSARFRHTPAIE